MPASFAQMPRVSQYPRRVRSLMRTALLVIALTFPVLFAPIAVAQRTPLPTHELAAAQSAVARAEGADAAQYAAEALLRAKTALGQAQAALAARKAADATGLAQLAAAEADYAYARSRDAIQRSELARRLAEIVDLRQRLGVEGSR